ncbi:unnamed protein product [Strongylus vulgaris]|uniref:Uncharacterized protein n=1 Tax=Strongylus vulgaris TaxID=40348 RepID=A0A3P7LIW9_STRVU|nr:unnamed protein product [Strongylus vulgaris]
MSDVREVQVHYSLLVGNSAGPSVPRTPQPISLEDVLLREGSIPEFLMSSVVCPPHYTTSPSMLCVVERLDGELFIYKKGWEAIYTIAVYATGSSSVSIE